MKIAKIILGILLLGALTAVAGIVIQWFHEQPHATAINNNDFLAIENNTPSAYKYVLLSELRAYTSGTNSNPNNTGYFQTNYVYVLVATNIYTTNAQIFFITNAVEYTQTTYSTNNILNNITNNLFVTTTEYVTNSFTVFQTNVFTETTTLYATNTLIYNITNNVLVTSNLFTTNAVIINLTNNVLVTSNLFTTNAIINNITNNVLVTSNLFTTNAIINNITNDVLVTSNLFTTNAIINNITNTYLLTTNVTATGIVFPEYAWAGPTNTLVCGGTNRWTFTATSDCAITQLLAYAAGYANSALLSITNSATTNITIRWSAPIRIPYGYSSREYVLTNSDVIMFSADVAKYGSNVVPRGFGP